MVNKNKKNFKFVTLLINISFFIIISYLIFNIIVGQINVAEKEREISDLENNIAEINAEIIEKERLLDVENNLTFMEQIARERLDYVEPNAKVYIDVSGK